MTHGAGLPWALSGGWLDDFLRRALEEDVGHGDVTTLAVVPASARARAEVVVKQPGVLAGLPVAARVFALLDPEVAFRPVLSDGDEVRSVPAVAARLEGPARAILTGERVALNVLQRLSGIATLSRRCVEAAGGRADVLDTRKTTPGMRLLEKYAVAVGGARNHRFGLYDGVLIKDNHIRAAGGVAQAVGLVRAAVHQGLRIEVECTDLQQVDEALAAGADIILFDNMDPATMREAVRRVAGRARTEASGGVTLANLPEVVATGVDAVSLGSLTHSARALDISVEVVEVTSGPA